MKPDVRLFRPEPEFGQTGVKSHDLDIPAEPCAGFVRAESITARSCGQFEPLPTRDKHEGCIGRDVEIIGV